MLVDMVLYPNSFIYSNSVVKPSSPIRPSNYKLQTDVNNNNRTRRGRARGRMIEGCVNRSLLRPRFLFADIEPQEFQLIFFICKHGLIGHLMQAQVIYT